jgi:hypothetical protein
MIYLIISNKLDQKPPIIHEITVVLLYLYSHRTSSA